MLKTIAAVSLELTQFVEALVLPLNAPQQQHVSQVADGLVTTQGSKTFSALYRHIVDDPCPKVDDRGEWLGVALTPGNVADVKQAAAQTGQTALRQAVRR